MEAVLVIGGLIVVWWLWTRYKTKRARDALFTERDISGPDWDSISEHLSSDERQIDACAGWTVGGDIDHPCVAYLTDRAIYVDIRPDTLAPREVVTIPFSTIGKCGVQNSDQGSPRLVVVFDPVGDGTSDGLQGLAVDLRPKGHGWDFGERVMEVAQ